ncbi:MAG: magnesium transporter CorA family protein [Candidatus Midichloria sp.]|nr:magnesium transporter CorA family protein [Candidatus Midichloria sp.]
MITVYTDLDNRLEKQEMSIGASIPHRTVLIDLYEPTAKEEQYIENILQINIPTRAEMDKIEVMSPFYKEGNAHYMTVTVLDKSSKEDHPDSTAVTFILTTEYIIVLRYSTPWSLVNFIARATRGIHQCNSPETVLSGILESFINKTADVLEEAGNELDDLLKAIFEKSSKQEIISSKRYNSVIRKIGHTGNLISKNRESLVSINRLLIYFSQIDDNNRLTSKKEFKAKFKNLAREVHSLGEYGNFLSQRNSFLLDATLGMISVEQNMIIKVFTVASAVFMPPTLIASIYGMNFENMPELSLTFGYPMALGMIIISALLPYFFFKKKKWL